MISPQYDRADLRGKAGQAKLNNCKEKGKKLGRILVLIYLSSSMLASPAQTLVKTVNIVGMLSIKA
jgi:hypothetical protein